MAGSDRFLPLLRLPTPVYLASVIFLAVLTLPGLADAGKWTNPDPVPMPAPSEPSGRIAPQNEQQILLSFAPIVKKVAPSVVNIYTSRVVTEKAVSPLFNDPFFRQFFGDKFKMQGPERKRVQNSLGSGVIVDEAGLIVTSYHVIKGSDQIKVVLADRREFKAEIISTDKQTDLAVLKVETGGEPLPAISFGNSDMLEVGDLVLAIGNPFGFTQTVTSGIVSAVAGRSSLGVSDFRFFIQTDAAINPGNSGGALVDMNGRLVGINTAIFTKSGGSHGLGFAIPVNMLKTVIAGAANGGPVVRPWIGASGQAVTADIAASMGLSRPAGVLVNKVRRFGPAEVAGLKVGDVIIAVEGREVVDLESMRFRIATLPVGGVASLDIIRHGGNMNLKLPLAPPPEIPPRDITPLSGNHPLSGATVANLSPAFNIELGLDDLAEGVVITQIQNGAPAQRLGFRPGDLVIKLNTIDIKSAKQLANLLDAPAQSFIFSVNRGGKILTQEYKQ